MNNMKLPSLTGQLLKSLYVPLFLTWIIGTLVVVIVASYFTEQAYDRALLDDAYSVASHVTLKATKNAEQLEIDLSANEMTTLLFDQSEIIYFQILNTDGSMIAGHPGFKAALPAKGAAPQFSNLEFQDKNFRTVAIYRTQPSPFFLVMAQTSDFRAALVERVVIFSIVPQLFFLGLLAFFLKGVIKKELAPLLDLENAVETRAVTDLSAVNIDTRTKDVHDLGTAINRLFFRIDDGVRLLREFSGNVAHELRTPLAGIRAQTEYGLANKNPEVWYQQLQGIAKSELRASHMVEQMLALSLTNEAKSGLIKEDIDVDELVKEAVMRFLSRADSLGVDLGVKGYALGLTIKTQRSLLEGALNNLIDNALRYGVSEIESFNQITIEIEKTVDDNKKNYLGISVLDHGKGISDEFKHQVMRRRTQGEAGLNLGAGAGLGLAIVVEYAKLLNAEFVLQDNAGGGLKALLKLPLD
jgi:two-component system sensor histidine kinase TctE